MAGTAIAAGALVVAATLSLGLAAVGGAAVAAQRVAGAADAAALAAADTASGAVSVIDDPCAVAQRVAEAAEASVASCAIDGPVATVEVHGAYAGLVVVARARAGPPGES
ncbi:MAG: helicase [Microbacterium sp.]